MGASGFLEPQASTWAQPAFKRGPAPDSIPAARWGALPEAESDLVEPCGVQPQSVQDAAQSSNFVDAVALEARLIAEASSRRGITAQLEEITRGHCSSRKTGKNKIPSTSISQLAPKDFEESLVAAASRGWATVAEEHGDDVAGSKAGGDAKVEGVYAHNESDKWYNESDSWESAQPWEDSSQYWEYQSQGNWKQARWYSEHPSHWQLHPRQTQRNETADKAMKKGSSLAVKEAQSQKKLAAEEKNKKYSTPAVAEGPGVLRVPWLFDGKDARGGYARAKDSPATKQMLAAEAAIPKSMGGIAQSLRTRGGTVESPTKRDSSFGTGAQMITIRR